MLHPNIIKECVTRTRRLTCAAQGWDFAWTAATSPPATPTLQPTTATPHHATATPQHATPTPPPQMPDGYIHLGGDMLLGVAEFLGYLKVHLRHYVVKKKPIHSNQNLNRHLSIPLASVFGQHFDSESRVSPCLLDDRTKTVPLGDRHKCRLSTCVQ
ncbi:hypothetical protein AVEN_198614-1 [Araneus ventricosus]|uniref:Uncharacterized protein n=1 Tax=Araneus ventricosus TaxID=182803 RepID=A0A4Y2NT31_ARAVE|nr:hypothetical protein AVEN_198614-1 [Araneus ventricosus]